MFVVADSTHTGRSEGRTRPLPTSRHSVCPGSAIKLQNINKGWGQYSPSESRPAWSICSKLNKMHLNEWFRWKNKTSRLVASRHAFTTASRAFCLFVCWGVVGATVFGQHWRKSTIDRQLIIGKLLIDFSRSIGCVRQKRHKANLHAVHHVKQADIFTWQYTRNPCHTRVCIWRTMDSWTTRYQFMMQQDPQYWVVNLNGNWVITWNTTPHKSRQPRSLALSQSNVARFFLEVIHLCQDVFGFVNISSNFVQSRVTHT